MAVYTPPVPRLSAYSARQAAGCVCAREFDSQLGANGRGRAWGIHNVCGGFMCDANGWQMAMQMALDM